MLAAPAEVLGLQVPPIQWVPPSVSTASGDEAIEMAELAGLVLDPWQRYVLRGALGERQDGKWAAAEVGLSVSRQNGKGSIIEARELAGLFLFGERLIVHTAHEFKTALEGFYRILELIESNPDFDRCVKRVSKSHGEEGIELKTRQRLKFAARSKGSGRGFSGDCVILDESMYLDSQQMSALLPTISARPNPQVWYTGSAGTHESTQMARVARRGRAGNAGRLAYFEWAIRHGNEDKSLNDAHDDIEAWARANPALGIRIPLEAIETEMSAMDDEDFARERLGVDTYPPEDSEGWAVISEGVWKAALDEESTMVDPVVFAVAVNQDRTFATIAAAGKRSDGLRHVDIVAHAAGTGWVVESLLELKAKWSPKGIAVDAGGPEGSLIADLKLAGIEPLELSARDLAQASGAFKDALTNEPSTVRHRDQVPLRTAVEKAQKRPLSESWAWLRKDAPTVGPLIAATVALHASVVIPDPKPKGKVHFLN